MKNWFKKYWLRGLIILIVLVIAGICAFKYWYVPYRNQVIVKRNLKNGFVIVKTFDCPKDHPIKANLRSMIYHLPHGTYYKRTNAANGYCFDTVNHAKKQGFRKSYNN